MRPFFVLAAAFLVAGCSDLFGPDPLLIVELGGPRSVEVQPVEAAFSCTFELWAEARGEGKEEARWTAVFVELVHDGEVVTTTERADFFGFEGIYSGDLQQTRLLTYTHAAAPFEVRFRALYDYNVDDPDDTERRETSHTVRCE